MTSSRRQWPWARRQNTPPNPVLAPPCLGCPAWGFQEYGSGPSKASLVYLTNLKGTGKNLSKIVFIRQD